MSRKKSSAHPDDGLSGVLGWEPPEVVGGRPGRPRAAATGAAIAALMGLVVALALLPVTLTGALSVTAAADYWDELPTELPNQAVPTRSRILAADGSVIAQFYSENRVPVTWRQVPQRMKNATVAIEDERFYTHSGVDVRGIARALVTNTLTDQTQGGSTLTQQYVKNMLLNAADDDQDRLAATSRTSYLRKLKEARLALAIEQRMTKDEILLGYLNVAYYGDGAYGVGAAAQHYFGKDARDLTFSEAALLAGIVKSPTDYNPTEHLRAATQRRNVVLGQMRRLGYLTDRQYEAARNSRVRLDVDDVPNGCVTSDYPFYCQWVRSQLETDPVFGRTTGQRQERLFRGGMTIRTALDPAAQKIAQDAVDESLGRGNRVASSVVVVRPGTGEVVAMATNRTFGQPKKGEFDRTELILPTMPAFQPGSNFKPITLAAALERGLDPADTIDAPAVYAPSELNFPGTGYANSTDGGTGTLNAAQAIWRSSNTWFVKLEEQVGVLNVASMAERLGITSLPTSGPRAIGPRDGALTLGAYEVSPVELAGVYATFAAHGVHCDPVPITGITVRRGTEDTDIDVPSADCHEAIPASVADTIAQIMAGTVDGPDPQRTGRGLGIGRPVAGKSGTTEENAAVWFSGFTPQYATSVWVGDPRGGFKYPLQDFYADGQLISRAYGGLVAGPIWREVMTGIHDGLPVEEFAAPATTVASGTVTPDVRGLSVDQAYRALKEAGFLVRIASRPGRRDPLLRPNRVLRSSPAAGTYLGLRSTVTLTLTKGSAPVRLPKGSPS